VLFIALTGDAKPHFTTVADFVSRSREAIAAVFAQVLTLLDGEGLIGRDMFAIDGVKLPSNASKHPSGTRAGFLAQAQKMERAASTMLDRHQANDAGAAEDVLDAKAAERIDRLTREVTKIRQWLTAHPEGRPGSRGKVRKSNRTDNESAKPATDKGCRPAARRFDTSADPAYDPALGVVSEGQGLWGSLSRGLSAPNWGWRRIRMLCRYCGN
jgi:hypothetical protein